MYRNYTARKHDNEKRRIMHDVFSILQGIKEKGASTHVRSNYRGYGPAERVSRSFKSLRITSARFAVR